MSAINPEVLALLACAACDSHPALQILDQDALVCPVCKRVYEICDGIINLLPEEAATLDEETND